MRAALVGLLGQIDNWFGYVAIDGSRSAFVLPWARCASVACAYPVLFFLVGYVFARQGNVGGVGLADPSAGDPVRLALLVWVVATGVFFFLARRRDWLVAAGEATAPLVRKAFPRAGSIGRTLTGMVYILALTVAVAGAVLVAGAGAVAAAGAVGVAAAGTGAGAGASGLIPTFGTLGFVLR